MAELWPRVLWKTELVVDETYPAEEISKQSIEGVAWVLLLLIDKCKRREIN